MSDLARIAGVSKSTVSRALAGSELVNKATRDRINSLAAELGYRMDKRARNFRLRESLTIGVAIPAGSHADWRISDPFFLELLGGISDAVAEYGHYLLLSKTSAQPADWIEEFVNSGATDGLILIGQGVQHEKINDLAEHYRPIVVWGADIGEDKHYLTVGSDNKKGGYLATHHLLEQGRRHIAYIGDTELPEAQLRFEGYLEALAEENIEFDPDLTAIPESRRNGGYAAARQLLDKGSDFDAIFCFSDMFAIEAIRALREAGLRVPEDVSVVGYDDLEISTYYHPSLTSIHQDRHEGGRILVERLLARVNGESAESVLLPTKIIVRESSIALPSL